MNKNNFDILIIGGGHAGLEAAWSAAQYKDLDIAILTAPNASIASAPCNPAVGGVGKGQVVREIDALGGVMGRLADLSAIQYRTLNESKGYAVQSTRVQIDKELYPEIAEKVVEEKENLSVIREFVDSISRVGENFKATLRNGEEVFGKKIVVTTGTFLGGKLHTGEDVSNGGRVDCDPSVGLSSLFSEVKTLGLRFKTGTPPRLKASSLDFSKFVEQKSDARSLNFHVLHDPKERFVEQVSCYIAHTNEETLGTIRKNKERSPIFNGQIQGIGPRYCPSIEDKAFRYEDRNVHHVFVEPESLRTDEIYPNGISTSLPKDVQETFVRSIEGFEKAEIAVYGYAVEYDVVDTSKLDLTLQYQDIPGLYFAGQVNGTSGYEEAAGQGLIAGSNAALSLKEKDSLILDRNSSYIGVMIEDLVSSSRDEPYRLFTARNENRLAIREDNSIQRMRPYRKLFDLDLEIDKFHAIFEKEYGVLQSLIRTSRIHSKDSKIKELFGWTPKSDKVSIEDCLSNPNIDPVAALQGFLKSIGVACNPHVLRSLAISSKYASYIKKSLNESKKLEKMAKKPLKWERLVEDQNISFECRQRIEKIRPSQFSQLLKISGIRPATLSYVASLY